MSKNWGYQQKTIVAKERLWCSRDARLMLLFSRFFINLVENFISSSNFWDWHWNVIQRPLEPFLGEDAIFLFCRLTFSTLWAISILAFKLRKFINFGVERPNGLRLRLTRILEDLFNIIIDDILFYKQYDTDAAHHCQIYLHEILY